MINTIIEKISEIEETSEAIVAKAEEQKIVLQQELNEKKARFSEELKADTAKKTAEIEADMKLDIDERIKKLQDTNQATMQSLSVEYDRECEKYADTIVQRIISYYKKESI